MKSRILSTALFFMATALLGMQAEAASFTVNSYKLGHRINLTLGDNDSMNVQTAFLDVTLQDNEATQKGYSFCVDLNAYISLGTFEAAVIDPPGVAADGRNWAAGAAIADRWAHHLGELSGDRRDAITGVQAAIWQAIYGSTLTINSMGEGAQEVYDYVTSLEYAGTGNTVVADFANRQDQTFTPGIPEPSAALIFGMGALLVSQAGRRRKA